ncbi:MAG TPA: chloride channel protein, partial [Acidimicrobiales bacterium]|nr:chloride channel protein [Acidimicrobiales bacterium]
AWTSRARASPGRAAGTGAVMGGLRRFLPATGEPGDRRADQRDFTTPTRVLWLVGLAVVVGVGAAFIAVVLLLLINFLVHLCFFGQVAADAKDPEGTQIGALMIPIAVAGEIIVGFVARYGSEQIRGHGIPESMQAILTRGSKVQPRLMVLKPLASAIGIGTGAPFGAEGPIIVSGGSLGSVVGQLVRLSGAERRALLVAGGMAGMTGVFGTPVAATLFGLEALVFERRPRSLVPIATACAVADGVRVSLSHVGLISTQPLFSVPRLPTLDGWGLLAAVAVGLAAAAAAWLMTHAVFASEHLFRKVPIPWMWWPAIAGVAIGLAGLVDDKALGVGYSVVNEALVGKIALAGLALLFVVKMLIWAFSLGSGTSGSIIAPILLMGASVGGVIASVLPVGSEPLWALVGMGATFAAMCRTPFTGIVFAAGLTHDYRNLLPLLIAAFTAHLVSVLVIKRSILTEKVVRKSQIPVSDEYIVDPLEGVQVSEVMRTGAVAVGADWPLSEVRRRLGTLAGAGGDQLYPVVDGAERVVGLLDASAIPDEDGPGDESARVGAVMVDGLDGAVRPSDTLRGAADRMVDQGVDALPVVEGTHLAGTVSHRDLLEAGERLLVEERRRERVLRPGRRLRSLTGSSPSEQADGEQP